MASVELDFDGERVVPGKTPVYLVWAHAARYRFVRDLVQGKSVLDAGSGEGYGSSFLAHHAASVVGIDLSVEAVGYAQRRYTRPNLSYAGMDCCSLGFADASFDLVCSFEVIEHFQEADKFLSEVRRVLRPGGVFVVSTPNRERNPEGVNPFHEHEYNGPELEAVLGRHFTTVDCYGQVCEKPLRETLFMHSTKLYMNNSIYRNVLNGLASLYFRGSRADSGSTDPVWVERMGPGAFSFRKGAPDLGTYLVAVCQREARHGSLAPGAARATSA